MVVGRGEEGNPGVVLGSGEEGDPFVVPKLKAVGPFVPGWPGEP